MRPRKAQPEEAHGPPAGKRSAWNGNQPYYILSYSLTKSQAAKRAAWLFCVVYKITAAIQPKIISGIL
ncbi:hypothetical protein B4U37_18230 [Sutcliffiella horikoshii]|uniref:Uncharacterized protein n=1 Tax=Sutcliffiella horikoshii TaxID=79883 RepID=A0A1Y0CR40_9BACI|nr:hypothetical protein B4U37_18230 [Sutcliffiella horikoshii]TYS60207.1 hypothetical protein FZC74_08690 [Sutcliffiella horikoshii]